MFQSIIVYTLSAFLLFQFGRMACICNNRPNQEEGLKSFFTNPGIIYSIITFALLAGLRYNVGVDHLSYLEEYSSLLEGRTVSRATFEGGFLYVSRLFASFGIPSVLYFAFWAALQIGFVYYAFREKRYLLPYIGLCIILGPWFLDWMNGIRQCVVECAFIFAVEFIERKKFLYYLLFVAAATSIHRSAAILLPIYLFAFIDDNWLKNRYLNIGILITCTVIGSIPTWLGILNNYANVLSFLGYEHYSDTLSQMTSENLRETAWGPSRISIYLSSAYIIWIYPSLKKYYDSDRRLGLYFILFFIGTCMYELFVNTSHIFLRPVEYFQIFRLPMVALTLFYLKSSNKQFAFWILLFMVCMYVYVAAYKGSLITPRIYDSNTYKFIWDSIS